MDREIMDHAASPTTPHIPREVEIDILQRLPIKSLIRFKCVGKVWYDLIQSPSFITLYNANIDQETKKAPLYVESFGVNYVNKIISTIDFRFSDNTRLIVSMPNIIVGHVTMVGCSNGLVCLSIEKDHNEYVVSNPATRDFRQIIYCSQPCRREKRRSFTSFFDYVRSGFISDSHTNIFKLARMQLITGYKIQVDIFTSSSNSWRKKTLDLPCQLHKENDICWVTCGKRSMYWTIKSTDDPEGPQSMYILCFDMVDELFRRIELPKLGCYYFHRWHFISFGDSIAVFIPTDDVTSGEGSYFDVWVMNDCGVTYPSWSDQPSFNLFLGGYTYPRRSYRKDGTDWLLLSSNSMPQHFLRDPYTGETAPFCGLACQKSFVYWETLAPVR